MAIPLRNTNPMISAGTDLMLPTSDTTQMRLAQRETLSTIGSMDFITDVAAFAPATVLSIADTFLTSFGALGDDSMENFLNKYTGAFGESFSRTRDTTQMVGDIGGMLIPAMLASKAVRVGGFLEKNATKVFGDKATRFFSTGKSNKELFKANFDRANILGQTRIKNLDNPSLGFTAQRRKAIGRSMADTLIEGIAADAAIAASMNSSDFLFPDEMTLVDNLGWFAGTNAVISAGAGLIAKQVMKTGVREAYTAGRAMAATKADFVAQMAPSNIVGMRGATIAVHSVLLDEAKNRLTVAAASAEGEAVTAAREEITGIQKRLSELTRFSFQDSPIEGITRSFAFKQGEAKFSPYLKTMQSAYDQDPNMAFGLRSLEIFDQDANVGFKERYETTLAKTQVGMKEAQAEIDFLTKLKNPNANQQKKLRKMRNKLGKLQTSLDDIVSTTGTVVEIDGTQTAMNRRAAIFQDGNRDVINFARVGTGVEVDGKMLLAGFDGSMTFGPMKKNVTFDLDDAGNILSSVEQMTPKVWSKLSHLQRTAGFDALQSSAERLNLETWAGVDVKTGAHFTQLDYLVNVVERSKGEALQKINGVTHIDELRFASLESKFEAYQGLRNEAAKAGSEGHIYSELNNVARALNLPNTDLPLLHFFESLRVANENVTMKLKPIVKDLAGLESAIKVFTDLPAAESLAGMRYEGSMLNLHRDRKPVLAVMRNTENRAALTSEDLRTAVATMRAQQAETLRRANSTLIVKNVMQEMDGLNAVVGNFQKNLQNTVHGISGFGAVERNIGQQAFRFRDDPAFQAARLIADVTEKRTDKEIEKMLKTASRNNKDMTIQQVFNKLVSNGNEAHQESFFMFRHALGAGWDLAPQGAAFKPIASNIASRQQVYNVVLDGKSARNKEIWARLFPGEEMPAGEQVLLPLVDPRTGQRTPIVLTQLAFDGAIEMNRLSQQLWKEEAARARSLNMKIPARKDFHLPPIDFSKTYREYLFDHAGNPVSVVGADTKGELASLVKKEIEASNGKLISLTEADVERYKGAKAEMFFGMTDFSRPSRQTGQAKGTAFGGTIRTGPNEFNKMVESILRGYSDIGRSMRMQMLDPEIQYLRMMKNSSGIDDATRTVYDELINTIAGTQNVDQNTAVGKILTTTEQVYDRFVQAMHDTKLAAREVGDFSSRDNRRATNNYNALEKELLGTFKPFSSVEDYLVRTNQTGVAPTLRKHAALLNEVTATLSLRAFDIGMGVINLLSLGATLPPVVAALAKQAGETDAARMSRIGVYGTVTPKGHAHFSPVKASITGIAFRNSDEGREVMARARARGFLDQAAYEQTEIWARTGESFLVGKLRDFSNKASMWTDWTERESRTIAFSTFYKIGRDGLGLQDNAAMLFAHQQANNTIADFRPGNRPAIFSGAAGMPLGLFTTYMWNYWQRIIGMVETKSARAGIWQAGMQASLFGGESLPGWDMYTGLFMENYDGSHTVVDRFNQAMGHTGADLFLNGGIAHLPKLLGVNDGISIGPRASVGVPFESGFGSQSVAGLRMLTRLGSTVGQLYDSAIEQEGISPSRVAEVLATANLNKGLSNTLELALGHSVDYSGSLIEDDTRTAIGVASRVLGFKPLMADELRQENVRNRATDRIQGELTDRLAENLKSRIRNGRLRSEDVEQSLEHYVRAGGNAENFRRFFQSQVLRATTSKLDLETLDALRGSIDEGRIGRLIYLSRD